MCWQMPCREFIAPDCPACLVCNLLVLTVSLKCFSRRRSYWETGLGWLACKGLG